MRAAIFLGKQSIEIREVDRPTITSGEILLRVKSCAICSTDIRIIREEKTRGVRIPSILGHEVSGEVVEIGGEVPTFKEGDRVAIAPVIPCKSCYYCMKGMENMCLNRTAIGYEYDGGMAEYMRVPAQAIKSGNVVKIPDSLSYDEASLLEPLACCINGIRKAKVGLNSVVVIIGAGPIGLMHLRLSKIVGAAQVIVSEPLESRRRSAQEFGADRCVDPQEQNLAEVVLEETNGLRADTVIMAKGITGLVDELMGMLKKGGVLNLFAGFPEAEKMKIDMNLIHYNELIVTGTSASTPFQYREALSLAKASMIDLNKFISHRFPLEEIDKAFDMAANFEGLKIIINP